MPDDPTAAAVDELYGGDPDDFLARRTELTKQCRAAGDAAAATRIAALRKPTRSAFAINRLARSDPDAVGRLLDLGREWQAVQASATAVDARRIRELTRDRRRLIDELTRAAFAAAGESHPSSAVRDEVVSTLTAALSDDAVADEIGRGVLVKPARWDEFGLGGPELTLVPGGAGTPDRSADRPAGSARSARGHPSAASAATSRPSAATPAARPRPTPAERRAAREAEQLAQAERAAEAERAAAREREAALARARQAVDEAEETLILATDEEQARVDRVHELEDQLTAARQAVDQARREVRRAELAQRRARDAFRRLDPES